MWTVIFVCRVYSFKFHFLYVQYVLISSKTRNTCLHLDLIFGSFSISLVSSIKLKQIGSPKSSIYPPRFPLQNPNRSRLHKGISSPFCFYLLLLNVGISFPHSQATMHTSIPPYRMGPRYGRWFINHY